MPKHSVLFRGIWSKPSIDKTMDGIVKTSYSATFDTGQNVSKKMKSVAAGVNKTYSSIDTLITNIERSDTLPSNFEETTTYGLMITMEQYTIILIQMKYI